MAKFDPGIMFVAVFWILMGIFLSLPDIYQPYFFIFALLMLFAILRFLKVKG